ncbi:MAG TPA: hypothetical protein VFC66_04035, partial [Anaerolineaceae bacterium]|nr:hypothetical protein [Anaerolineaceae bacterium]
LGEYIIPVSLTLDLVPEIRVIVHREGEVYTPPVEEVFVEIEEFEVIEEIEIETSETEETAE